MNASKIAYAISLGITVILVDIFLRETSKIVKSIFYSQDTLSSFLKASLLKLNVAPGG